MEDTVSFFIGLTFGMVMILILMITVENVNKHKFFITMTTFIVLIFLWICLFIHEGKLPLGSMPHNVHSTLLLIADSTINFIAKTIAVMKNFFKI